MYVYIYIYAYMYMYTEPFRWISLQGQCTLLVEVTDDHWWFRAVVVLWRSGSEIANGVVVLVGHLGGLSTKSWGLTMNDT